MKERKEKKRYGLMLFLVIMMVGTSFSVIFYGFSSPAAKQKQNGHTFVTNGQAWITKIDGKQAAFSYLPNDVANLKIEGNLPDLKGRIEIDSTSNTSEVLNQSIALAQHQMGLTLYNYGIFVRNGFASNNTYSVPIITCNDATPEVPVIFFMSGNETKITVNGNCIIAYAADSAGIIQIKDRILYSALGVING
jgi:hypothetical protein